MSNSQHTILIQHRQCPLRLAGRRQHRIGKRRCDRWHAGFPDAARPLSALNQVYLDIGTFIERADRIAVEIGLRNPTALDGDPAIERCGR